MPRVSPVLASYMVGNYSTRRKPQVLCPLCGRRRGINNSGAVRRHSLPGGSPCPNSGRILAPLIGKEQQVS